MSKIVIKPKIKQKKDPCPICGQHMDLCVTSHKSKPFVDNKTYPKMCFTCYSVPKILKQKYGENGYIIEQIELPYDIKNLHKPQELFYEGSADSLEQARMCVNSVKKLVVKKQINNKIKPKLDFYLTE